MSNVGGAMSNA